MRRHLPHLLGLTLLWGVAAGCGQGPVGPLEELVGSRWSLEKLETTDGPVPLPDEFPRPPALTFGTELAADGLRQLEGAGGCNLLGGHYLAERGGRLLVPVLWATEMACLAPDVMPTESAFLQVLAGARSWSIRDGRLRVIARSGTLTLRRAG